MKFLRMTREENSECILIVWHFNCRQINLWSYKCLTKIVIYCISRNSRRCKEKCAKIYLLQVRQHSYLRTAWLEATCLLLSSSSQTWVCRTLRSPLNHIYCGAFSSQVVYILGKKVWNGVYILINVIICTCRWIATLKEKKKHLPSQVMIPIASKCVLLCVPIFLICKAYFAFIYHVLWLFFFCVAHCSTLI